MTWIKLDDKAPRHPKIAGLSDRAFRWWVSALCYASEFLTDGELPYPFLRTVPKAVAKEIRDSRLWITETNGTVRIHDYLIHQTGRAEIERERERSRQRRNGGQPPAQPANDQRYDRRSTAGRTGERPRPEAEVEADTENREQKAESRGQKVLRHPGLMRSPLEYERALQRCAYVGARLEVPKKLHADLVRDTGGPDADGRLRVWYAAVDAEIETSGEAIVPDVFKWLTARWRTWAAAHARLASTSGVPDVDATRRMLAEAEARARS